ncbi:hypothetical protein CWI39_0204p0040 [Hamiltosporidium magnivora]|uniref:Uncharacterized protein n=1 Tax=Hamiltosporidium magnivora TaxID=148818 RepID=A0A4V2JWK0_9MICR|nr:hypothetical protein CWI39_0204p0040 [Hamiltosporidium magnivora]
MFIKLLSSFLNPDLDDSSEHLSEKRVQLKKITEKMPYETEIKDPVTNPDLIIPGLREELLYETILNLNSFLFIIEINNMSDKYLEKIIETVIFIGRNKILNLKKHKNNLKDELWKLFDIFSNFSRKIDLSKDSKLKKALEFRNYYFDRDKSQIAKSLFIEELHELKKNLQKYSSDEILELIEVKDFDTKDFKYSKMIKALRRSIIETQNLSKSIQREKREFIQEFIESNAPISQYNHKKLNEIRMEFNLGGSIFEPNLLFQICSDLILGEKEEVIVKAISKILKPIENLELYLRHKTNTERKEEILKFLYSCLKEQASKFRDEIDDAFRARSELMGKYLEKETEQSIIQKEKSIDKYQENFIQDMISRFSEINEAALTNFMVINKDIVHKYIRFLNTGSTKEKSSLIEHFSE